MKRHRKFVGDNRVAFAIILLIALVLTLGHCHALPAEPLPQPEHTPTREELRQTNQHIIKLAQELEEDLNAANANSAQIAGHLGSVSDSLATATHELVAKQKEIDKLGAHAGDLELTLARKNAQIRIFIIAFLSLAVLDAAYLFLKFYLHLPI